jgi:hypothetical protein
MNICDDSLVVMMTIHRGRHRLNGTSMLTAVVVTVAAALIMLPGSVQASIGRASTSRWATSRRPGCTPLSTRWETGMH